MAQAILMGKDGGSGGGKGIKVLEASTSNVIDFNTLTEPGVYLLKGLNENTALNTPFTLSTDYFYTFIMSVRTSENISSGATSVCQEVRITNNDYPFRIRYLGANGTWGDWSASINAGTIGKGTLAGQVKANATSVQTLGTAQVRNIYAGTSDLTAGTSTLATGDIYFCYE